MKSEQQANLLEKMVNALTEPLEAKSRSKGRLLTFMESMEDCVFNGKYFNPRDHSFCEHFPLPKQDVLCIFLTHNLFVYKKSVCAVSIHFLLQDVASRIWSERQEFIVSQSPLLDNCAGSVHTDEFIAQLASQCTLNTGQLSFSKGYTKDHEGFHETSSVSN